MTLQSISNKMHHGVGVVVDVRRGSPHTRGQMRRNNTIKECIRRLTRTVAHVGNSAGNVPPLAQLQHKVQGQVVVGAPKVGQEDVVLLVHW